MDESVLDYLESYKRLDQLCRDMFRSKDGVTEYINQMDRVIYLELIRKKIGETSIRD